MHRDSNERQRDDEARHALRQIGGAFNDGHERPPVAASEEGQRGRKQQRQCRSAYAVAD